MEFEDKWTREVVKVKSAMKEGRSGCIFETEVDNEQPVARELRVENEHPVAPYDDPRTLDTRKASINAMSI